MQSKCANVRRFTSTTGVLGSLVFSGLVLCVSAPAFAQTVPEVVKPRSDSPPPARDGRAGGRSDSPPIEEGGRKTIPDSGVIKPPASGAATTPVIKPPSTGTMPVIRPPVPLPGNAPATK